MFKCHCGYQSKPRETGKMMVMTQRVKVYPPREGDPGGAGWETEKELYLCNPCANKIQ